MIGAMPRPRPLHLHREVTRHGEVSWYVRIGKGPRVRIKQEYGTPAFEVAYQAAIKGEALPTGTAARAGSLSWLIGRYRESDPWSKLSPAVRIHRERVFKGLIKAAGIEPFTRIDRKAVVAGRDRRRATPHAARLFVQTIRGLFKWAIAAEHAAMDPTLGVDTPRPKTAGFATWTPEWCAAFEAAYPLGTRERVAYDVLLHTGLRRGDAVRLGRPHVKNNVATIRTEKTGEIVTIPLSAALLRSLEQGPVGELTFIAGERGKPMTKESFGNWFGEACRAAGVSGAAHGIRKARATKAAENGATESELDAMFGWRGGGMASLYTDAANRARLATEAAAKLEQESNFYSRTSVSGAGMGAKTKVKPNG